jgi:glucokinase
VSNRAVGVDVGGTKILGLLVDESGEVVAEARQPTPATGEEVLDAIASVAVQLHADAKPGAIGVGVGMPGLVDRVGVLRFAPNLPQVVDLDVLSGMRRRLDAAGAAGLAIAVDNDATCAGVAEHALGAARGTANAVVVTLGTGIGGALFAGGELVRGSSNFAGEIGHLVVDADGRPCSCGSRGCWEVYASGTALGRLAREAAAEGRADGIVQLAGSIEAVRGEHVVEAATLGDRGAADVFAQYAAWLAVGLANLANLLDPEIFVLGGGLVRAGDVLLGPTRVAFRAAVEGVEYRPEMPIVPAERGSEAGAVGAAVLALKLAARAAASG